MSNPLKDGDDSGRVPDSLKLQIFVNQLGICAEPDCSIRLMQNETKLGECAHIIPKIVGFTREDYTTPLEDRRKEPNLVYLCRHHHQLVDNKKHVDLYPAKLLHKWKQDHKIWAAGVQKNSPYMPQWFKDKFTDIEKQISEEVNVSEAIISDLLDTCRELLHRQFLNEATVFLSQIDILLLKTDNVKLNARADLLGAILSIRKEQIPEAKEQLLQIIQTHPHYVDAMLEYVELCENAPEPTDKVINIENLARDLTNDHPRLQLIDIMRMYNKHEVVEINEIPTIWSEDVWLNARFIRQYALFFDAIEETRKRDNLIDRWENELPNSPRPYLFRVIFRIHDVVRSPNRSPIEDTRLVQEALEFFNDERERANTKDPIMLRDQISWLIQEMRLELIYANITGVDKDFSKIRNELVSMIEECYFDSFIDNILLEFLHNLRLEPHQWESVTRKIKGSNVLPSQKCVGLLLLQALPFSELQSELESFVNNYSYADLQKILQTMKTGDAQEVAKLVNSQNDIVFSRLLLHSIPDPELVISLTKYLEVNPEYEDDILYARLKTLEKIGLDEEALDIIQTLSVEGAAPHTLHIIGRIAFRNQHWHLFVPVALQLLNFDIPQRNKILIHGELASVFGHQGDHSNAIIHAELALSQSEELGEEDRQAILHILAQSYDMKGSPDEGCAKFQEFGHIHRSFTLLLVEADLYLKSSLDGKYEKSLSLILRAFEEADVYEDRLFVSVLELLIELSNVGKIPIDEEPIIDDGLFVKLDGFRDGWFYVGAERKSLGAVQINPGTSNYDAVIQKHISEEVQWPADKFSAPDIRHRILHIATPPAYLAWRAHEALENLAHIGDDSALMIHVPTEKDSLILENLEQFYKEQYQHENTFFETYINTLIPFSFLCKMQGGVVQAIGKISSEGKGFIRCNDGTQADFEGQELLAGETLNGAGCFIDGLSALMLTEAQLLEKVIHTVPNLGVSTSVIRLLRTIAGDLKTTVSSIGRGAFVEGKFQYIPRDKEKEETFRNLLLRSADLLDTLPNKVIGKTYPASEGDVNLNHILPDYFVDPFRYSQEEGVFILTDDAYLIEAYKLSGESSIPKHFSSLSLVKVMAENKQVAWVSYLKYFSLLSSYRYHFLPITVDDMIRAVFPPTTSGLVTAAPRNIAFLNLPLVLSSEYGVDDNTTAHLLSTFFTKIILDSTIPQEIADEIFALTIRQGLNGRDKRIMAKTLVQICNQNLRNLRLVSQASMEKFKILEKQLSSVAQGIDPIVIGSSLLLKESNRIGYD